MNMNTTCRNWLVIAFLGFWKFAVCVSAESSPPEAVTLIENTKTQVDQLVKQSGDRDAFLPLIVYLNTLSTNWSGTLKRDPREVTEMARGLHEVMQFYFAGRSDYSSRTLDTLLHFRVPLKLSYEEQQIQHLVQADLRIRIAWFRLLGDLDPNKVFPDDPKMIVLGVTMQFLRDLRQEYLAKALTPEDFDVVMKCLHQFPVFSDDYILSLAKRHDNVYPGEGYYARRERIPNRFEAYRSLLTPLRLPGQSDIRQLYIILAAENPRALLPTWIALDKWIMRDTSAIEDILKKAGSFELAKVEVGQYYSGSLAGLLSRLETVKETNVQQATEGTLDKSEIRYVFDINDYLCEMDESFSPDCTKRIKDLQDSIGVSQWQDIIQNSCEPSRNLQHPVEILARYGTKAGSSDLDRLISELKRRLEELQKSSQSLCPNAQQRP